MSSINVQPSASLFESAIHPFLAETHPLPPNAGFTRKCLDKLLCPPHSCTGGVLFLVLVLVLSWATLASLTGKEALPGGNLFALLVLFFACWCGGYMVALVKLPPLLGQFWCLIFSYIYITI